MSAPTLAHLPVEQVLSVSQLNECVRALLEDAFPLVWVEGELSNVSRPGSGHLYFTLKDARAQVRCAMFRNRNRVLRFRPENGQHVKVRASLGLYTARGDYQLIVEHLEPYGDGALQQAYEALRRKLGEEGLFDDNQKRALPRFPRRLGVITSATGAALRDILSVTGRRYPALPVLLYATQVQGTDAPRGIVSALATAARRRECDALIIARGGGSLEDLQAFNDESVARAIHDCPIPTVSGVGHESDFTIADFVVDVRAATPSAAAELATPSARQWSERFAAIESQLARFASSRLTQLGQRLDWLERRARAQHPGQRLKERRQRLRELTTRLRSAREREQSARARRLEHLTKRLRAASPALAIRQRLAHCNGLGNRLTTGTQARLRLTRQHLAATVRALATLSPLSTLERGYAIVRRTHDRRLVRAFDEVAVGELIEARLARGGLRCTVDARQEGVSGETLASLGIDSSAK